MADACLRGVLTILPTNIEHPGKQEAMHEDDEVPCRDEVPGDAESPLALVDKG